MTAIPGCKKNCPTPGKGGGANWGDFGRIGQDMRRGSFYVFAMQRPIPPAAGRVAALRRLREALEVTPGRPMAEVARRIGVSERGLYRQARVLLEEGPADHRRRQRLNEAALDLLTSARQVIEIALASGYASPEGFCRAFRRRFGQSPSRWRRSGSERAPRGISLALAFARHLQLGFTHPPLAKTSPQS